MHSYKVVILLFQIGDGENTFFFMQTVFESSMLLKTSINVVTLLIYRKNKGSLSHLFYILSFI